MQETETRMEIMTTIRTTLMNNDPKLLKPEATSLAFNLMKALNRRGFLKWE